MILHDLNQRIVVDIYNLFVEIANVTQRQVPDLAAVRAALESETRRFVVTPVGHPYKAELWYNQDATKNLVFTFAYPADLPASQIEKAEAAKAAFDTRLQAYLVDYYI